MKLNQITMTAVVCMFIFSNASAQLYTIEPDTFADQAVLNTVLPQVNLFTVDRSNGWYLFDVTARNDDQGFAPTGQRVFAHVNIPFWNDDRRLRMDFHSPVSYVSIAFGGGDILATDYGRLEIYNSAGLLLDSYVTGWLAPGMVETMSLSRPAGDIAWAVAYTPLGGGSFGRLDDLQFQVVPEPSAGALLLLAGSTFLVRGLNIRKIVVPKRWIR